MMAVDYTTAGAASGETALAAPKGSQSQAKGQKSIDLEFGVPVFGRQMLFWYSSKRDWEASRLFFYWVFYI